MKTLEILRKLIEIKSQGKNDLTREEEICTYLENYLKENYKFLNLERIRSEDGSNILFALGSINPKTIFACHMDTVPESKNKHNILQIKGDKAFGLGTKDMKGGIVSTLLALDILKNVEDFGIIFYGDEEYNQNGMKFLEKYVPNMSLKPKLIVSPESRFNILYGARGIIVVEVKVKGLKAHSARPQLGRDAIKGLYKIVEELENKYGNETELGNTTFTIASINGGVLDSKDEIDIHAGSIPDICKGVISIRNSQTNLKGKDVKQKIIKTAKKLELEALVEITEEYPTRYVNKSFVENIRSLVNKDLNIEVELGDPKLSGYNDAAILGEVLNCKVINFGPYGEDNHTANEWVSISSIEKTGKVLAYINDNVEQFI